MQRPRIFLITLAVVAIASIGPPAGEARGEGAGPGPASDGRPWLLWYSKPATRWPEALPVGNGRMGAMVFGGVEEERIQFNEDSLWTGQPQDYQHEGAAEYLPEVRRLLFEGKQRDAERLAGERMMSVPLRQEAYQPFGDLNLEFPGHAGFRDYRREVDIDEAVARVSYRVGDVVHSREILASHPDGVIAVRIAADRPGQVTFDASLTSPHEDSETASLAGDTLALRGRVTHRSHTQTESRLRFEGRLRITARGGKVAVTEEKASVRGADEAVLVLAAATSYRSFRDISGDPGRRCEEALRRLEQKPFAGILEEHAADHRRLFRRVHIDLGTSDASRKETDQRIREFASGEDPQLAALFFQFGRYLLIASSREGGQPANLQGLWNESLNPPWESKYTVNINTEMNYWPAELTNLPECHEPLFAMLADCSITGSRTARTFYGCGGWVLHHNTDLWRGTAPINAANHGIWVTGGAWLCQHLWWRYDFTRDEAFLRDRAYPILKGAAEFFLEFLVEHPEKGWLISTPSNSPEQGGLVAGPTMDHQIIRGLLGNCIEASEILGVDEDLRRRLVDVRARIAPNQIGKHGQLQEWLEDKDDPRNQHRHVSHLWGLHPGSEITRRGTPDLWEAARKSLEMRGDGGTGWSMAWKINFWARLEDGDRAYKMLSSLLTPRRTYPNLFDSHPPFQIDGNFGAASGIAEMLLQSHAGEVHLLPALPSAWPSGEVRGLCARGALEIDIRWEKGRLKGASILSRRGLPCRIRCGDRTVEIETREGHRSELDGDLRVLRED